jgi:mannose-6-phosphate isomerase-like protein (cupin superfamily)
MKGYTLNIEEETLKNDDYRRVLYTAKNSQLVLMCLRPGEEIGEEVHRLDQFIRVEAGKAVIEIDGVAHDLSEDHAAIIPAGARHNVKNTGGSPVKLYTLYSPPEHKDGIVEHTKADEVEEHFDGKTTE